MWSFCSAKLNRDLCLSIALRISLTSSFRKGQASAFPAFLHPSTGANLRASRSRADLNCSSGPFGVLSDANVIDQEWPYCDCVARSFRKYKRPLMLATSLSSLWRSSEAPFTSLRYSITVPLSCRTATMLAEMLSGSAISLPRGTLLRIFNGAPGGAQLDFSSVLQNASSNMTIITDAKVHYPLVGGVVKG